jgi:hypothetical protein
MPNQIRKIITASKITRTEIKNNRLLIFLVVNHGLLPFRGFVLDMRDVRPDRPKGWGIDPGPGTRARGQGGRQVFISQIKFLLFPQHLSQSNT